MIKKLVSHLGEYKRAAVLTPLFAALEAVMDVLLPTIMAFIIDHCTAHFLGAGRRPHPCAG